MSIAFFSFTASKPEVENIELTNEEAFNTMMQVLTHKRCVNCHPSGNAPRQGEESRIHDFGVERGKVNCQQCHTTENNSFSGVPGAPHWALAPASMKWEGLTKYEIAASILDTTKNGGRSHEELIHHLTEHELVLWAWNPGTTPAGNKREAVPVPLDEYKKAVLYWFENDAKIPEHKD
ncbi:MAG: hypothetical protein ACPGLV_05920 [Bacteroidia bacterium]